MVILDGLDIHLVKKLTACV